MKRCNVSSWGKVYSPGLEGISSVCKLNVGTGEMQGDSGLQGAGGMDAGSCICIPGLEGRGIRMKGGEHILGYPPPTHNWADSERCLKILSLL